MIEKSLTIILFMYASSVGLIAGQYILGDVYHIEMKNFNDDVMDADLVSSWMDLTTFNNVTYNIVNGTYYPVNATDTFYNKVETFTTAAAAVAWNLISLLSGLYILNLVYFLGVALPIVSGLGILYLLLLSRAIIGYVRGI